MRLHSKLLFVESARLGDAMSAFARVAIDIVAQNARGLLGQGVRDVAVMCSVVIGQVFMRHQLQLGTAFSLVVPLGVLGLLGFLLILLLILRGLWGHPALGALSKQTWRYLSCRDHRGYWSTSTVGNRGDFGSWSWGIGRTHGLEHCLAYSRGND